MSQAGKPKKKKEKPRLKEPIEGTDWIKVTTTEDNVFYSHRETKEARWDMPEEVKAKLAAAEEAKEEEAEESGEEEIPVQEEEESEETRRIREELDRERGVKRPSDGHGEGKRKKPRVVSEIEELEKDEEWQKSVAEEMAKEAEREEQGGTPEKEEKSPVPALGEYSSEESRALFKVRFRHSSFHGNATDIAAGNALRKRHITACSLGRRVTEIYQGSSIYTYVGLSCPVAVPF
jgi:hypothetical protein